MSIRSYLRVSLMAMLPTIASTNVLPEALGLQLAHLLRELSEPLRLVRHLALQPRELLLALGELHLELARSRSAAALLGGRARGQLRDDLLPPRELLAEQGDLAGARRDLLPQLNHVGAGPASGRLGGGQRAEPLLELVLLPADGLDLGVELRGL